MKRVSLLLLTICLFNIHAVSVHGQTKPESSAAPQADQSQTSVNTTPPPRPADHKARRLSLLTDSELYLSLEVLVFGVIVLFLEFFLLRKSGITAEEALRVYAVTVILVGTLFAITAGFTSQDVAPAMGLFGTIAGYLLGKKTSNEDDGKKEEAQP